MGQRTTTLAARLESRGAETVAFFADLEGDQWQVRVYSEGTQWTPHQILAHFVSAERAFNLIFEDVLADGEGAPEGVDIDEFNEAEVAKLAEKDRASLLKAFQRIRAQTVDLISGMDDSDLDREGRHPWFGFDRMEKFVKLVYRHNMIHQRDIRRTLDLEV